MVRLITGRPKRRLKLSEIRGKRYKKYPNKKKNKKNNEVYIFKLYVNDSFIKKYHKINKVCKDIPLFVPYMKSNEAEKIINGTKRHKLVKVNKVNYIYSIYIT